VVAFHVAGSSLKICLVAEGIADIYPRLGPTMEWDTAAAQAVAECAGARVCLYGKKQPLRYNRENLLNPWFVVER
jgi:3'(2'), 5'-bisphosphate nucleotidase